MLLLARICERLAFERRRSFAATLLVITLGFCALPRWLAGLHLQFEGQDISPRLMTVFLLAVAASNVMLALGVLIAREVWARNLAIPLSAAPILLVLLLGPAIVSSRQMSHSTPENPAGRIQMHVVSIEASPPDQNVRKREGESFLQVLRSRENYFR